MPQLQDIMLPQNQFSGPLPPALGNSLTVQNIYLNNNQLAGGIPTTFGNLKNLQAMNVSFNDLTGLIPDIFSGMTNLWLLDLSNNAFNGEIPTTLANTPKLQILKLQSNALTGKIPTFASIHLSGLNVASNYFYGSNVVARKGASGTQCIATMPYGGSSEQNCFSMSSSCLEFQKTTLDCEAFCGTTSSGQCGGKGVCIAHPAPHCVTPSGVPTGPVVKCKWEKNKLLKKLFCKSKKKGAK
eukprot:TRINITY_DN48531_c0_g1_i2.p1 TRINITY_DN48531_c0_g1~~TRINITY_DN48531_c0_g1_i2.p1  ORF type:complete len:267 (+),score=17.21 TRINITY_DN48531_c0_g1_i2:81-803(+)